MDERPASEQIDAIIDKQDKWKSTILQQIRSVIKETDPEIVEEIKWRMANRPEGLAVWTHDGIVCFAEIWKDNIKLIFPKGAALEAQTTLFNARLKSAAVRAIEFKEGHSVDAPALAQLLSFAIAANTGK